MSPVKSAFICVYLRLISKRLTIHGRWSAFIGGYLTVFGDQSSRFRVVDLRLSAADPRVRSQKAEVRRVFVEIIGVYLRLSAANKTIHDLQFTDTSRRSPAAGETA